MAFTDALRGYAHRVLERDNFTCRYCGLDGRIWRTGCTSGWDAHRATGWRGREANRRTGPPAANRDPLPAREATPASFRR